MITPTLSKKILLNKRHLTGRRIILCDKILPLRRWTWKPNPKAQRLKEVVETVFLVVAVVVFILLTMI